MVSAVHRHPFDCQMGGIVEVASKGLHMVSAVHRQISGTKMSANLTLGIVLCMGEGFLFPPPALPSGERIAFVARWFPRHF